MMKQILCFLWMLTSINLTQSQSQGNMETRIIQTRIGKIATHIKVGNANEMPVIFLHGVYFDHHLWKNQMAEMNNRTVIAIDMPFHGQSKISNTDWNLNDCANMLIEVLDSLQISKVIAVGHSWGSMTIVRAIEKNENRFHKIFLCNMPFSELSPTEKRNISLQHLAIVFRSLYMKQAGKSLFGKKILADNPTLIQALINPMRRLSNKEIKLTDKKVRMEAQDVSEIIKKISVPTLAIIGKEDYVGKPPLENVIEVEGGHVSPLEVPQLVNELLLKWINNE